MNESAKQPSAVQPSRRKLFKAGLATTAAAYVAPQVLRTSVAGAQTLSLFVYEVFPNSSCSAENFASDGSHTGCDDAINPTLRSFVIGGAHLGCPTSVDGANTVDFFNNNLSVELAGAFNGGFDFGAECEVLILAALLEDGSCMASPVGTFFSADSPISSVVVAANCIGSPVGTIDR